MSMLEIRVKDIISGIHIIKYLGDEQIKIHNIIHPDMDNQDPNVLMWVSDKNVDILNHIHSGVIICSGKFSNYQSGCNYIVVENPRLAFKQLLEMFFNTSSVNEWVAPTAQIHSSAKIGKNTYIGHHVVIEEGCTIGENTSIQHNTVIHRNTIIGRNVKIGANNTIGGVGFGYEKDEEGKYSLIPHIGNVVIHDHVEMGNNICIDRAVLGSTELHENVKIDNQVHIAHGVTIGANSLIIAHAMIGGSAKIGENVWVAPSSSVINKISIGDHAVIGMGAVVIKNVNAGETIIGNPGRVLNK